MNSFIIFCFDRPIMIIRKPDGKFQSGEKIYEADELIDLVTEEKGISAWDRYSLIQFIKQGEVCPA